VINNDETRREVFLPRGVWYDFWSDRRYTGPTSVTVDPPLDHIPIFARGGAIVPTQQVVEYTDQAPINPLTFEIYPDGALARDYYEADGLSFDPQRGISLQQHLSISADEHGADITITARQGSYNPPARSLVLKLHAQHQKPGRVEMNGKVLTVLESPTALDSATEGWAYDAVHDLVWIKTPDQGVAMTARVEK